MPPREWSPDDVFPPCDEFESSVEYSEFVTNKILSDFETEKMGAEPRQSLKRRAKFFGNAYSSYRCSETHMLSDSDLDWAIYVGAEDYSETKAKSFIPMLRDWFFKFGWQTVNLEYLFSNYDSSSDARVIVASSVPDFEEILAGTDQEASLSTNTIKRVLLEQLPELKSNTTEVDSKHEDQKVEIPEIELAISGVETGLQEHGWLPLEGLNTEMRVWIHTGRLFEEIRSYLEGQTAVEQQALHEKILSFLSSEGVEIGEGVTVTSEAVIGKFEQRLRDENWDSLVLEDGKTWYSEEEEYVQALREKLDEFEEPMEHPVRFPDDYLAVVYRFLNQNTHGLVRHDFYERGWLAWKAGRIKRHSNARETLDKLDEADRERLSGEIFNPYEDTESGDEE